MTIITITMNSRIVLSTGEMEVLNFAWRILHRKIGRSI